MRGSSGAGPALPELIKRLRAAIIVMLLLFLVLIGRLWQLQVMRGDGYYQRTVENVVHERFLPSIRGKILDRKGVPLAANRLAYNLYVTPATYPAAAAELTRLLGLTDEEAAKLQERALAGAKRSAKTPVLGLEDQGTERAALVDQANLRLPGVEIRSEPYRFYPEGEVAAHVVGYMTQMNAEEQERLAGQGYGQSEMVGRYGIESMFENYLRGKKGKERYAVDAKGHRIDDAMAAGLIEGERVVDPVAGSDVVLTLDLKLQKIAERAVAPYAAAGVVVVEVKTGRILAMVSKPAFDPNIMTGHLTRADQALLDSDPRKPFIDKTLRMTYPPGSIFKFVTALAALTDGQVTEDEKVTCTGQYELSGNTFDCTAAHGPLDLLGAIQHSCNVYFWHLAERVGLDRMSEVARDYGLGVPTGLGLNGDAPGRIPTRPWYEQRGKYKVGFATNAATGQGDVEVTVLQMAMAYAALANGGTLWVPQIVARVLDGDGKLVLEYEPKVARVIKTPPEAVDVWKRGMYKVVNEPGGTGYPYATSTVVTILGKSGTAEVKSKSRRERLEERTMEGWHPTNSHAWFAGWAPAEDPEIAVVVMIEHGGGGGKVAGPLAKAIIEGYFTKVKDGGQSIAPATPTAPHPEDKP